MPAAQTPSTDFDFAAHQREKIRRLEQQIGGLERHRTQLERVILLMLNQWFHDTHTDGLDYLRTIVEIDLSMQELGL